MNPDTARTPRSLAKDVLLFQGKLVLDTLRDFALSPLSLVAALVDFVLSKRQAPRYFRAVMKLGERSEEWIDLWSAARDGESPPRANVEALLSRIEEVVRDPQTGARRARVLKRWAERQMQRARLRIENEARARLVDDSKRDPK